MTEYRIVPQGPEEVRRQEVLKSRGETDKQVTPEADQNIHSSRLELCKRRSWFKIFAIGVFRSNSKEKY